MINQLNTNVHRITVTTPEDLMVMMVGGLLGSDDDVVGFFDDYELLFELTLLWFLSDGNWSKIFKLLSEIPSSSYF